MALGNGFLYAWERTDSPGLSPTITSSSASPSGCLLVRRLAQAVSGRSSKTPEKPGSLVWHGISKIIQKSGRLTTGTQPPHLSVHAALLQPLSPSGVRLQAPSNNRAPLSPSPPLINHRLSSRSPNHTKLPMPNQ